MPITNNGPVFSTFLQNKTIDAARLQRSEAAVERLVSDEVATHPGMLLGKIQSGKTGTFMTILALAFDNGFDVAVVFTKGVKVLTKQTVARLKADFLVATQRALVQVYDIMSMPSNLPAWGLNQKLIIVCKKEDDNIARLQDFMTNVYPILAQRRTLIIDDEADFASVGYRRTAGQVMATTIPRQIDGLRQVCPNLRFLQVTATPYSLYLQPEEAPATNGLVLPIRPAFTLTVPTGASYVGGEHYFERSQQEGTIEHYFYVPVPNSEMESLRREDRAAFAIGHSVTAEEVSCLRRAFVSFLLGGSIRRWHVSADRDAVLPHYAFIVHTETGTLSHEWQVRVVQALRDGLAALTPDSEQLRELVDASLVDLGESLAIANLRAPTLQDAAQMVSDALAAVIVLPVNKDSDLEMLLDESGQLQLQMPYNVFVGGSILDRGITIRNLIGFFYGRRPRKYQQDTVLQHARMYGYRDRADLAVTRFYTTPAIYDVLREIHAFDNDLRETIEAGLQPPNICFLMTDRIGRILQTAPHKVLASQRETIRPGRAHQLLPEGFDVDRERAATPVGRVDGLLEPEFGPISDTLPAFGAVSAETACTILDNIAKSLDFSSSGKWDVKVHKAMLRYLVGITEASEVFTMVRRDRRINRISPRGRLQSDPSSSTEVANVLDACAGRPSLLLYRQNGLEENGWAGAPFWWPVFVVPPTVPPHVFALGRG